jgi:hypothetical protein
MIDAWSVGRGETCAASLTEDADLIEFEGAYHTERQEIASAFKVAVTTYAVHLHGSKQKIGKFTRP